MFVWLLHQGGFAKEIAQNDGQLSDGLQSAFSLCSGQLILFKINHDPADLADVGPDAALISNSRRFRLRLSQTRQVWEQIGSVSWQWQPTDQVTGAAS